MTPSRNGPLPVMTPGVPLPWFIDPAIASAMDNSLSLNRRISMFTNLSSPSRPWTSSVTMSSLAPVLVNLYCAQYPWKTAISIPPCPSRVLLSELPIKISSNSPAIIFSMPLKMSVPISAASPPAVVVAMPVSRLTVIPARAEVYLTVSTPIPPV